MMDLCCMHLLSFMTLSALNVTPAINYILCDVHMSIHTHAQAGTKDCFFSVLVSFFLFIPFIPLSSTDSSVRFGNLA